MVNVVSNMLSNSLNATNMVVGRINTQQSNNWEMQGEGGGDGSTVFTEWEVIFLFSKH